MADSKISGLPVSTTPLAGTEVLPIVQGGQTKQVSVANLTAGRAINATTVSAATTVGVGAATPSASGAGITFPATQSASTDVNTLDDYEEGTFTPTVIGTTSAGTGTYTTQVGSYTKIGNRIFYNIYLNWTAHTGTGNMRVTGLPFLTNNAAGNLSSPSVWPNNITLTANNILVALLGANSSTIILYQYAVGGGSVNNVAIDTAGDLAITGHYEV